MILITSKRVVQNTQTVNGLKRQVFQLLQSQLGFEQRCFGDVFLEEDVVDPGAYIVDPGKDKPSLTNGLPLLASGAISLTWWKCGSLSLPFVHFLTSPNRSCTDRNSAPRSLEVFAASPRSRRTLESNSAIQINKFPAEYDFEPVNSLSFRSKLFFLPRQWRAKYLMIINTWLRITRGGARTGLDS